MKEGVWNFFAPIYERAMKSQKSIYDYIYKEISAAASAKNVLELATGPGMIAKHIAPSAKSVTATDFAPKMIEAAKKGSVPDNVSFEVADATNLRYQNDSFDLVVIANALHIIPEPEKALAEIDRVLKANGTLIAPNFIEREKGKKNLWQKILSLVGIKFAHEWTKEEYKTFLSDHGWQVTKSHVCKGRIDLLYAECKRIK
ncbi:MAG: class I SAM-dependent methyltransferase [Treponema sp.]|nr:class I SAM-dependent methyltransferase [Treponema sp.]MBQ2570855.1 class I SAM-dependent methyltransferase [Treponema sp.]MBQ5498901.1 class I SAM-dependent methyltransferase [Treponema sp.]